MRSQGDTVRGHQDTSSGFLHQLFKMGEAVGGDGLNKVLLAGKMGIDGGVTH